MRETALLIWTSIWRHPFRWILSAVFGAMAWDVIGRGLVEQSEPVMAIFDQWWMAVKLFFDHPIGEVILMFLTVWLVWSAVAKTVKGDSEKKLEADSSAAKTLEKYDARFNALFAYISNDGRRSTLENVKVEVQRHAASVNDWVSGLKDTENPFENERYGLGGALVGVLGELDRILERASQRTTKDLRAPASEVDASIKGRTISPHFGDIKNNALAEAYKAHMERITLALQKNRSHDRKWRPECSVSGTSHISRRWV